MRARAWPTIGTLCAVAFALLDPAPLSAKITEGAGSARALLIAVGDPIPLEGEWTPLSSSEDIVRLQRSLTGRGLSAASIRLLDGAEATRSGILTAIGEQLAEAPVGSDLLLHWSGHGVQWADEDGDEPDGLDESWVPWGARRGGPRAAFLLDDDLAKALDAARLAVGPTGSLVVTIDACHGAGSTRGAAGAASTLAGARWSMGADDGKAPLIVLAASRSDQQAREILGPDGKAVGAFSAALADILAASPAAASWQAVHDRVRASMGRVVPGQRPQLSGPGDLPVLGAAPGAASWSLPVEGVLSDGRVRIGGGLLHGVEVGSRVQIHRAGSDALTAANLLAEARVVEVGPSSALVQPSQPGPSSESFQGARVTLAQERATSLTLHLHGPPGWTEAWTRRALDVGIGLDDESAELTLSLAGDAQRLERRSTPGSWGVSAPADPGGTEAIGRVLRRLASAERVLALPLNDPTFRVGVRLLRALPGTCEVTGVHSEAAAEGARVEVGDTVRLELEHHGELPAWLSVVHVDENGLGEQLLPLAEELSEPLHPGVVWRAPTCWTITQPARDQRIRVLATPRPAELRVLLQGETLRGLPPTGFAVDLALHVIQPLAGAAR